MQTGSTSTPIKSPLISHEIEEQIARIEAEGERKLTAITNDMSSKIQALQKEQTRLKETLLEKEKELDGFHQQFHKLSQERDELKTSLGSRERDVHKIQAAYNQKGVKLNECIAKMKAQKEREKRHKKIVEDFASKSKQVLITVVQAVKELRNSFSSSLDLLLKKQYFKVDDPTKNLSRELSILLEDYNKSLPIKEFEELSSKKKRSPKDPKQNFCEIFGDVPPLLRGFEGIQENYSNLLSTLRKVGGNLFRFDTNELDDDDASFSSNPKNKSEAVSESGEPKSDPQKDVLQALERFNFSFNEKKLTVSYCREFFELITKGPVFEKTENLIGKGTSKLIELREAVDEKNRTIEMISSSLEEKISLEKQKDFLKQKLTSIVDEREILEKTKKEQKNELHELKTQTNIQLKDLANLTHEITVLKSQIDHSRSTHALALDHFDSLKEKFEKEQAKLESLNTSIQEIERDNQMLQKKLYSAIVENESLAKEKSNLINHHNSMIDRLKTLDDEHESMRQFIDEYISRIESSQSEQQSFEKIKNNTKYEAIQNYSIKVAEKVERQLEVQIKKDTISFKLEEVDRLNTESQRLQSELDSMCNLESLVENKIKNHQNLINELREKKSKKATIQEQFKFYSEQIKSLTIQIQEEFGVTQDSDIELLNDSTLTQNFVGIDEINLQVKKLSNRFEEIVFQIQQNFHESNHKNLKSLGINSNVNSCTTSAYGIDPSEPANKNFKTELANASEKVEELENLIVAKIESLGECLIQTKGKLKEANQLLASKEKEGNNALIEITNIKKAITHSLRNTLPEGIRLDQILHWIMKTVSLFLSCSTNLIKGTKEWSQSRVVLLQFMEIHLQANKNILQKKIDEDGLVAIWKNISGQYTSNLESMIRKLILIKTQGGK